MFTGQTDLLSTNEILRDKNSILNLYTSSNFHWVSKVIRNCFGFALLRLVIDPEESRHFFKQSKCKTENQSLLGGPRFPAL